MPANKARIRRLRYSPDWEESESTLLFGEIFPPLIHRAAIILRF